MESLVSTQWLADNSEAPDLVVVDASSHLPDAQRDAAAEFAQAHVPGARFLDLASLTDSASPVPAALPTDAQFAARMEALGIANGQRIVLYDDSAIRTSARAWFIFRMHAAEQVAILDGGLGKWRAEGRPLEGGTDVQRESRFATVTGPAPVRSKQAINANIASRAEQLVDARGAARFTGDEPDHRPNVASGHIPGSLNLPYTAVFNPDGTYKTPDEIRAAFAAAGVRLDQPIITTCGSGVTASALLFALHLAGKQDVSLYDGSWSEWGADPTLPKATGEAA